MSQGAAGSGLTFLYANREGKVPDLGGCMCNPLTCPRDPAWLGVNRQGPRKGLSGAVVVVAVW